MDKNDRHIFDQIRESQITKVFVSIYGNENDENNKKAIANAHRFLSKKGCIVDFFTAETAPIWGKIQVPA